MINVEIVTWNYKEQYLFLKNNEGIHIVVKLFVCTYKEHSCKCKFINSKTFMIPYKVTKSYFR